MRADEPANSASAAQYRRDVANVENDAGILKIPLVQHPLRDSFHQGNILVPNLLETNGGVELVGHLKTFSSKAATSLLVKPLTSMFSAPVHATCQCASTKPARLPWSASALARNMLLRTPWFSPRMQKPGMLFNTLMSNVEPLLPTVTTNTVSRAETTTKQIKNKKSRFMTKTLTRTSGFRLLLELEHAQARVVVEQCVQRDRSWRR